MVEVKPIAVGDAVAYSAAFLSNTGQHAGDVPFRRGTVVECVQLGDRTLCRVCWSDGQESSVLDANLARPGSRAFCDPSPPVPV